MANFESSVLKIGGDTITLVDKQAREDISAFDERLTEVEENGVSVETVSNSNVVVCYKNGSDYQMRLPLEDKVYCVPFNSKGSNNNTLDFKGQALYLSADINSAEKITATSAYAYKNWTDDICPVHYNNEYRCAGHGISGAYDVTCTGHGLTESDIGSLWSAYVSSLSKTVTYVIVSIIDENTLLIVSDDTGNAKAPVSKGTPTSPLVHVSGATHTTDIPFTATAFRYVTPSCNGQNFFVRSAEGEILENDGLLKSERYIDVVESYYSLNYQETIAYLKENVGSNKNDTYYNDDRVRELFYQTTYRFFPSGCCLISFSATPLLESVCVDYFGGTQCTGLGTIKFVPYTNDYKTPTSITSKIGLTKDTWEDETFPPYKMFEISDDNEEYAFGVGYVADYGQSSPNVRSATNSAGDINHPGNKMYPYLYFEATSSSISSLGKSYNGYAWKAPMIVKDNKIMTWYMIGEDIYIETEILGAYDGFLELPNVCDGKRISVIKATDNVTMLADVVSSQGVYVKTDGVASMTLKCY